MEDRTASQLRFLLQQQDAHEQRLRVLQIQSAQQGIQTPAAIVVEARHIQEEVYSISLQISKLQISHTNADYRQYMAENTSNLADVSLQLSSSTDTIRRTQQTMFTQLIQWFDLDKDAREKRQRTTTAFYIAILVMLAIDIVIRFWK